MNTLYEHDNIDVTPNITLTPMSTKVKVSGSALAQNALMSYVSTLSGLATGLLVTPLMLHHMGPTMFGLWMLLVSIIGYTGLLEIGLQFTISKRVSEYLLLEDRERLSILLSNAFAIYVIGAILVLLVTGVIIACVNTIIPVLPEHLVVTKRCLLLLGFNQAVTFLFLSQGAILFGAGRSYISTGYFTVINVLVSIINIVLVMHGYSIVALGWVAVISTFIGGAIGRYVIVRYMPEMHFNLRRISWNTSRDLIKFGSRNATLSVAGSIAFNSDLFVIGMVLPVSNVAYYVVASKIAGFISSISVKPMTILMPAYTHSDVSDDKERQHALFTESIKMAMGVALPFVVSICIFGERIIQAWVGKGHGISVPIAIVLALAQLCLLPGFASYSILTATENNALLVRIYLVAAFVNISLSYLLTHLYGPIGVALGTLITVSIVDANLLPLLVCQQYQLSFKTYLLRSLVPLLLPMFAALFAAECVSAMRLPNGYLSVGFMMATVITACWSTLIFTGIEPTRRQSYMHSLRVALGR